MDRGRGKGHLHPMALFLFAIILVWGEATVNAQPSPFKHPGSDSQSHEYSNVDPAGHHKQTGGGLSTVYYAATCPGLTNKVFSAVKCLIQKDNTLPAAWLRLHFHDCFVNGCDASVLINGSDPNQEINAIPNFNSLRGLDALETLKTAVEQICPGVVSCADILALAARDAIHILSGAYWSVSFGRRDGLVSNKIDAEKILPRPTSNYSTLVQNFANLGFTAKEMVTLSGAHTIGYVHCSFFQARLYNFPNSRNGVDPTLDPTYAQQLQQQCPQAPVSIPVHASGPRIALDPTGGGQDFDSTYFSNVLKNKGILTSDATLITGPNTLLYVNRESGSTFLPNYNFFNDFGDAMEKMGRLNVILAPLGQIRRVCRAFNS